MLASEKMAENIININNLIESNQKMNIHEYQAKEILTKYGVETPKGGIAYSPENAKDMATELGGDMWVVKAQIHSGARGKASGIIVCNSQRSIRCSKYFIRKNSCYQSNWPGGFNGF